MELSTASCQSWNNVNEQAGQWCINNPTTASSIMWGAGGVLIHQLWNGNLDPSTAIFISSVAFLLPASIEMQEVYCGMPSYNFTERDVVDACLLGFPKALSSFVHNIVRTF